MEISSPSTEMFDSTARLTKAEEYLRLAKVDPSDLHAETQVVSFAAPLLSDDYRLIELDKHLLERLEQGETIILRGTENDIPVLCTDKQTFQVKEAETSNALLLSPDCHATGNVVKEGVHFLGACQVVSVRSHYLELKEVVRLKTSRLRELLEERPFFGWENETDSQANCYSIDDLLEQVQGSKAQLLQVIETLPVCEIDGKLRQLAFEYRSRMLADLVDTCESGQTTGLSEDHLNRQAVREFFAANKAPPSFTDWFLRALCTATDVPDVLRLDERQVCRHYAELLLRGTKRFNWDDFWTAWCQCVPVNMTPKESFLEGLGLIEQGARIKTIELFPVEDLPEDPQERFDLLFRRRPKWRHADMEPYLRDLATSPKEIGVLLTKFCRSTTVGGQKLYNSRDSSYSA
uniref:Sister chromatid cohesion protein DCC1 n=1 Tax=Plectus sambesii TaxID=2011161 RepID=A0A914XL29_9BILA